MAYTVTDIAELIHYHLVLAEPDNETADNNLAQLTAKLQRLSTRPLCQEISWVFCDRCTTMVDSDLIHPDGHHYSDDGDFYCSDCWFGPDDPEDDSR